nr:cryparin [Verruciconidia persicina]
MKFFTVAAIIACGATLALATDTPYVPCRSTIYSNPLCCATDALGIVGLDCEVPPAIPNDPNHFRHVCSQAGQQAKCCVVPVADQAVLCDNPVGLN